MARWVKLSLVLAWSGLLISSSAVTWAAKRNTKQKSTKSTASNNARLQTASDRAKGCVEAKVGKKSFDQLIANKRPATDKENKIIAACDAGGTKTSPSTSLGLQARKPEADIFPEVWTKNGWDGASYEFKVNCGSKYEKLEECFLWDLTNVTVTTPEKITYELNKDFNINSYSGEVTRRWVLYGPGGGGLPKAGRYRFAYIRGATAVHYQDVTYSPEVVDPPGNVRFERSGNDLTISWDPPAGINRTMWYKPSIDPPGNDRQIISKTVGWDRTSAVLENPPVNAGEKIEVNVAVFFRGGYAYPASTTVIW